MRASRYPELESAEVLLKVSVAGVNDVPDVADFAFALVEDGHASP